MTQLGGQANLFHAEGPYRDFENARKESARHNPNTPKSRGECSNSPVSKNRPLLYSSRLLRSNSYRNSRSTLDLVENGAKNRLSTVFWYMSDVKSGGETNFPRFNGSPPPRDTKSCNVGLNVKPKKGKVIIFHNMLPDGSLDPLSLHAGCSVTEGEKWSANKWIWNKPYSTNGWIGDDTDLAKEANVDLYTTNNSLHTHDYRHRILGASSVFSGTISSDGDMALFGEDHFIQSILYIAGGDCNWGAL